METLTANLAGRTRRDTLNGREHIVAPLSLIVPGVLNGSQGPLLYPPEEVAKNHTAWNHMPIVVYHPLLNGVSISARDPDVLNRQQVGVVLRSAVNGKLTAEAWFDVERTKHVDNRVLVALQTDQPIEVSTGLFTDNEIAEGENPNFNGTPYDRIARNYRPDHLAVLPDQKGACSLDDGCGVNVNSEQLSNLKPGESVVVDSVPTQKLRQIMDDSGGGFVWDKVFVENESKYRIIRTENNIHPNLLGSTGMTRKHQHTVRVDEEGFGQTNWVDGHIHLIRRFSLESADGHTHSLKRDSLVDTALTENEDQIMAKLADEERKVLVDAVIHNCDCWKEEDEKTLNTLADHQLQGLLKAGKKLIEQQAVINAAKKGYTDPGGNEHTWNEEKVEWDTKLKAVEKTGETVVTTNTTDPKPQTAEEWFKSAPSEVQEMSREHARVTNAEKSRLVETIVANAEESNQESVKKYAEGLDLDALRMTAMMVPKSTQEENPFAANYSGAAGAGSNVVREIPKPEPLGQPVWNFEEQID